ncbi:hypothetical protein [Rhodococcus sp. B10]|uniref:hypothetical protein n=1 Tax=Rhodococcus sp. B10 TaxID=2695876 RepID=UPI0014312C39|nr:hypothetical protein [Rhodococcus sp. B10]NIL77177.1 hypothetical protein [Rhodococcus sp. B10]
MKKPTDYEQTSAIYREAAAALRNAASAINLSAVHLDHMSPYGITSDVVRAGETTAAVLELTNEIVSRLLRQHCDQLLSRVTNG